MALPNYTPAGVFNLGGNTAVSPSSTTPDASEQGFGGPGSGSLTGVTQSMPNSLNNNLINPGGYVSGLLTGIYGGKYQVPNPGTTAGASIAENINNLGDLGNLTLGTDTLAAQGAALPYQMNLPDYSGMLASATGNAAADLSGSIPQDVQNQLQEAAAERGISTGQGADSPNIDANYLDAMGLTSLGLEQTGLGDFQTLMGATPTGQQFNPSTMYVTPEQQQAAQLAANEEAAAPQPQLSGLFNTVAGMF